MVKMEGICAAVHGLKPAMIMMTVQAAFAGVNVFYKLAADDGMNLKIIIAYRFIFATLFIVPLALLVDRKSMTKLTRRIVMQGFFCGLFGGTLGQNLYIESLSLTSATFASAMSNLIPAITFILALCFGMERLVLGTWAGKAKVSGTLISVGGAMLLTFYKGVDINIWSTHINLLHDDLSSSQTHNHNHNGTHQMLGAMLALASCFSYAFWLIIQTKMSAAYPYQYSSTALMAFMGSIQSTVFALCSERDLDAWRLGWNIRLVASAFNGIVASGLMVTLISWCVRMRGPLYVSIFNPLMLVLVAIAGSLLLDEKLHLGSILGAVLIVCGLYVVLWGKGRELKRMIQLAPDENVEIIIASQERNDDCKDQGEKNGDSEDHYNKIESTNIPIIMQ